MTRPSQTPHSPGTRRSPVRWILIAVGIVVLAIVLLASLAPTLASTSWATRLIERKVAESGAGTLTLDDLRLSWHRGVHVRGLSFQDPAGTTAVEVDAVEVATPLWRIASAQRDVGTIRIERPALRISARPSVEPPTPPAEPEPTRPRDEGRPAPRRPEPSPEAVRLPFRGRLLITDGEVAVTHPEFERVVVRDISAELDAQTPASGIPVSLSATAQQGDLSGDLSVKGRVTGFGSDGSFQPARLRAEGVVEAVDLPVEGIDTLVEANGLLAAALGDRINLRLSADQSQTSDADATAPKPMLLLEVVSDRLNGTIDIAAQADRVSGDGEIRWTVAPEFVAMLGKAAGAAAAGNPAADRPTLTRAVDVRLRLVSFAVPAGAFRPGAASFEIDASVDDGSVEFAEDLGMWSWSGVKANVASPNLADTAAARLQAAISSKEETGTVQGQVTLSRLFSDDGELRPEGPDFDGGFMLRDMPTPLIDRIAQAEGWIRDALGPSLNLSVTAKRKQGDPGSARLFADSSQAQLRVPLRFAERIALESPATLRWTAGPEMTSRLSENPSMQVALGEPVTLTVDSLDAPLPGNGAAKNWAGDSRVSATLQTGDIEIRMPAGEDRPERLFTMKNLDVRLGGGSILEPTATATALLRLGNEKAPETIALGEELSAELSMLASLDEELRPDAVDLSGTARSTGSGPLQSLSFEGRLVNGMTSLELAKPAQAVYSLSPGRYDRIVGDKENAPRLISDAEIRVVADRLDASLSPFRPAELQASAALSSPRLELASASDEERLVLQDVRMTALLNGPGNSLDLRIEGKAAEAGARDPGSILVTDTTGPWIRDNKIDFARASHQASITTRQLPIALVDAFAGTDGLLPALLGPALALQADVRAEPEKETGVDVRANTDRLRASAALSLDERSGIAARSPVELTWTLTPDAYARLTRAENGENPATLAAPVEIDAKIPTLRIPRRSATTADRVGSPAFDLPGSSVNAALSFSLATWQMRDTGDKVDIEDLAVDVSGETLNEARIRAAGAVRAVTSRGKSVPGKLDVDTRLANLFTPSGDFNAENLSVDAKIRAEELPLELLRAFGQSPDFASATFGDRLSMEVGAEIKGGAGPLDASLQSANASATLKGRYGDGRLTLAEPVTAQLTVTDKLGSMVLSRLHPVFSTAQTADRPLTLTIPHEGVVIPVADFQLRDVTVPAMRWDLGGEDPETGGYSFGTLELKTGGLLGAVLSFAQQKGKLQGRRTDVVTVRMTPLVLRLENGTLDYARRLDLLVDDAVRIITWGRVGLDTDPDDTRDASNVQLFLGIPGRTLDDVFGLDGVAADEMFTIPVRGTTTGARIDWQAAAADMATLQAQLRLAKDPLAGALVRQVLRELLGGKAPPAPPPSLPLVPWLQPASEAPGAGGAVGEPAPAEAAEPAPRPTREGPPAKPDPLGDALRGILGNL